MNDDQIWQKIEEDLQKVPSGVVMYLEGKTDTEILPALLGRPKSSDDVYGRGVLLVSLGGCRPVVRYLRVAEHRNELRRVIGVCDGDGHDRGLLLGQINTKRACDPFYWPTFSIENLLAQTVWPQAWGCEPDWCAALVEYAPYVALRTLRQEMYNEFSNLRFEPQEAGCLLTIPDMQGALSNLFFHRLVERLDEIFRDFQTQFFDLSAFRFADLNEAHTQINGKWLLNLAKRRSPNLQNRTTTTAIIRAQWCDAVRAAGGLAEVKDWWTRVTGEQLA